MMPVACDTKTKIDKMWVRRITIYLLPMLKTLIWQRTWPRPIALAAGIALGLALAQPGARADDFQGATHLTPFDEDTIHYGQAPATGPIARLQRRLDQEEVKLKHDDAFGYLLSVLAELKISTNSQLLVGSKTSFQRERISPKSPRAIFFNDDVYIGFIPGAPLLEASMADPKLGGVFYTLEQAPAGRPKFVRNDQCLECHASAKTMGVPGHLVRSFAVDESGVVDLSSGPSLVTHRTPLAERWGGWFVTGTHGSQTHRGNLFGKDAFAQQEKEPNFRGNLTDLKPFFDLTSYPSARSDVVAHLVLEHQAHLHNFITRLNYETTMALQAYGHIRYLKGVAESFLKYLLFTEEAPLAAPVQGAPGFATQFAALGPRDHQGRSLRDLDLQTRLFRYPCSYLIYSEAFDSLPEPMKAHLYQRLHDILEGKDPSPEFQQIPATTRRAIREILVETKKGLPDYWKQL